MDSNPGLWTLQAFGRRIPFSFLEETQQRFFATFPSATAQGAKAYEYEAQFSPVLRERMHFWSHDPSADAINRVRGAVADVKSVMIENIEKVADRGESTILVDVLSDLSFGSLPVIEDP